MMRLTLAVSLRRCRSLPKAAIHGLPLPLSARSFSARACEIPGPERNPAFGCHRLGAPEDRVGNFERRLHTLMLPYLWACGLPPRFGNQGKHRCPSALGHKPIPVRELALSLPASAWKTVVWREGTGKSLRSCFAAVRIRTALLPPLHRLITAISKHPRIFSPTPASTHFFPYGLG
jgi:hypothetical protein